MPNGDGTGPRSGQGRRGGPCGKPRRFSQGRRGKRDGTGPRRRGN